MYTTAEFTQNPLFTAFASTDEARVAYIQQVLDDAGQDFSQELWCNRHQRLVFLMTAHRLTLLDQAASQQAAVAETPGAIAVVPGQVSSVSGGHGSGSFSVKTFGSAEQFAVDDLSRTIYGQMILEIYPQKALVSGFVV